MTFTLRPYSSDDALGVVALINADAAQTLGFIRAVVDGVGNVRLMRFVSPSAEKVVAVNTENEVLGYAYLADKEQSIIFEVGGAVHPAYWGQGIGTQLLEWAIERAQVLSEQAPLNTKTVLQTNLYEAEESARQLVESIGFQLVREWSHLVVHFDAPSSVTIPEGITIRLMDLDEDWDVVSPVMDEVFADHWGTLPPPHDDIEEDAEIEEEEEEVAYDDSYSNSPGFCFLAYQGETLVGGVLCNAKLVERDDTGRVGSLFVRAAYRGQGIGKALMQTAFHTFWDTGKRRMILDTDSASLTDAPRFYMSLGMELYRREFLYEKEIKAGQELRRLS